MFNLFSGFNELPMVDVFVVIHRLRETNLILVSFKGLKSQYLTK